MTNPISALELTRVLIGFDTINPPGNERPCAEHLGRMLEAAGARISYHAFADDRTSLIARIGGGTGRPPICFTGHIDTVPLGAMPWSMEPFAAEIADGRLYGRGSSDMKSGVAAFVVAATRLATRLEGTAGVVLVITAGEETGCEGAFHLAGLGTVLGEAGAVVVAEPTSNYPYVGHKGALWLKARTRGVTAHGSMPDKGVNAVYAAARAVGLLEDFDFNVERHAHLGKPTLNVGTIHGGLNINSVPDLAEIGIDIRTVPGQRHAAVSEEMASYLGGEVDLSAMVDVESVWTDPADPWVREVYEIVAPVLGETIEPRGASYFTDAAALTPAYGGPPTVILGPGEPAMAHRTDEYCLVERIEQAVEVYAEIIERWCAP